MNLVYGEVTELFIENGMKMGSVRVSGALKKVPLDLLTSVQSGDKVLLCDGIAISRVIDTGANKIRYVSGNSR
jgi:hydrogenase maturation factor